MNEDFLIIFIYICAVVILLFVRLAARYFWLAAKVYKVFAKLLFFNFLIRLLLEKYLQFCISAFINLRSLSFILPSDSFSSVAAIVMTCIFVITPPFILALLLRQKTRLGQQQQKERFGTLYMDLKYHSNAALVHNVIFVTRRLTYAVAVVTLEGYFIVQYILLLSQGLIIICYYYHYKPFRRPLTNYMEIFNELCYIVCLYHILSFADSQADEKVKYKIGWSLILFTIICIVVNMALLIYDSFKVLKLHCRKLKQRIDICKKAKKEKAHGTLTSPERNDFSPLDQTNQTQQFQARERENIRQFQNERSHPQPKNVNVKPKPGWSRKQFQKTKKEMMSSYYRQTQQILPNSTQPQSTNNQKSTDYATTSQMNSQPAGTATKNSHLYDLSELKDTHGVRAQQNLHSKPIRLNIGDRLKNRQAQRNMILGAQTFRQVDSSKVLKEESDPISPFVTWKSPNFNERDKDSPNSTVTNNQIRQPSRSSAHQDEIMIEEEIKEQPYPDYKEDFMQEVISAYQKGFYLNQD